MLDREKAIMKRAINPLTIFPPIIAIIARPGVRKGAFNFDWWINSTVNTPARPPPKNPTQMPGPPKNGVSNNDPPIAPEAAAPKDFFEAIGWIAPPITKKKSIVSAIIAKISRNKTILNPT